jgi:phosphoadenylyl-sulfate reductase (thioredoxin)
MKVILALSSLLSVSLAFAPTAFRRSSNVAVSMADTAEKTVFDQEQYVAESKEMRLKHLEEQSMFALKIACENYGNAVFPNAMIAGDVVITDLLGRMGYLKDGKAKIMVVDTFHLFPETMEFLKTLEEKYEFKAEVFCAEGIPVGDKEAFDKRYGADLWKEDIDEYDRVCKVEPFQRGLKTCKTDCMINGRTRWQGAERAWIDLFENAPIGGGLAKCNPLAYWTLEDTFDYIAKSKVPYHPLHEQGYPSIGDAKDTIPVPEDGSVRFIDGEWSGDKTIWLDYGKERIGRFVGLTKKDGSTKTECGIHVTGAERTWDRDLWEEGSSVKKLNTVEEAEEVKNSGKVSLVTVYAPWCQFSQAMEGALEDFAKDMGDKINVYSFRGDDKREFVMENLNTQSFPTVNVIMPDGTAVKYESDERTPEAFAKFMDETLGAYSP